MNWHSIQPSALALVTAPLLLAIGAFSPAAHAGGTISACPALVNSPGIWKVTGPLTATAECIIIATNGAAIDLGGYTITGSAKGESWGVGEEGGKFSSVIIANGTIKNFAYGILLATTTNATIAKIKAENNFMGIVAYKPVVITETQANNNVQYGMLLENTNNTIVNSRTNNNGVGGMSLANTGGNTVINSQANSNKFAGIEIEGSSNSVIGNTADRNGNTGIGVNCPSDLYANTASGNNPTHNIAVGPATGCVRLDNNPGP